MYKKLVIYVTLFILMLSCSKKNEGKIVGKYEGKNEQICDITKEADQLYLDHYYLNKSATTAGDNSFTDATGKRVRKGTLINAGATLNHRKSKLVYEEKEDVYKWDEGKFSINVKLIDDDRLVLEFPGEHRTYNRVK